MASIFGRAIIVTKTNKSGGALAKGDVVIVDTANDNAVTTTTSAGTTVTVGVVVEENGIANNASGRVQFGGHVSLVNVNASVTRGHYGATHTVAKQATDAGASRVVGTFCYFSTGGTTPEADLFSQPDASSATGNVATDAIWDAAGDLAQGTGANTAAVLSAGATGKVLQAAGAAAAVAWKYPPGYEFDYAEITSNVTPTNTTEGTADTVVTGNAVTYDGSTIVMIEFYCTNARPATDAAGRTLTFTLVDGGSSLGSWAIINSPVNGQSNNHPIRLSRRLTPSNASHTYGVEAFVSAGTGLVAAGAGGAGAAMPAFIRITKVSGGA